MLSFYNEMPFQNKQSSVTLLMYVADDSEKSHGYQEPH